MSYYHIGRAKSSQVNWRRIKWLLIVAAVIGYSVTVAAWWIEGNCNQEMQDQSSYENI